jgi:ABC-type sugar transport system ATPase subunit
MTDGGEPALMVAGQRLDLAPDLSSALAARPDGGDGLLTLGLRPQDLALGAPGAPGAVAGQVDMVELLGSEKLVTVMLDGATAVVVQVKADAPVREGETVGILADPGRLRLFAADGRALRASDRNQARA